ncbi:non-homologous end-joining DNA ligase [Rhizobium sp. Rhizsp42]|uniref:non-homologous end-joining DNA ligase n=1 Tax=Rhizobium sp. Rhizsp42 TaxID=3243034 RepID=UPI0039B0699E
MTKPPKSKPLLGDVDAPIRSRPRRKRVPDQPALPFDPLPERVEPALALLKQRPPSRGLSWEIKWDGYRIHVHVEPGRVRVLTRGGHDWTHRFPAIAKAAEELGPATMILDGEAVVFDDQGRSDFNLLQASLGATGKAPGNLTSDALMMAFDLIYFDGHDLRGVEYASRRHLLEDLLRSSENAIRLSEAVDGDPDTIFDHACRLGLEGIVGKKLDSTYRSGRTEDWVKCKCVLSDAFLIVGYEPSTSLTGGFASLLLAAYDGDSLVYVGNVGTGFKHTQVSDLRSILDKLRWKRKQPPVEYGGARKVAWVHPTLIAEIEYRAWTSDRKLRHSSFKGLREVQDNADVYRTSDEAEGS